MRSAFSVAPTNKRTASLSRSNDCDQHITYSGLNFLLIAPVDEREHVFKPCIHPAILLTTSFCLARVYLLLLFVLQPGMKIPM